MTFDTLEVLGRYRMSSWFSTSSGDFNVTLIRVVAEGFVGLVVDTDGSLQASNITFDVGFKDIAMKFDNLGFFGNLFQVFYYTLKLNALQMLTSVPFFRASSTRWVHSSSTRSNRLSLTRSTTKSRRDLIHK